MKSSVADPKCLSRIRNFFHPGSRKDSQTQKIVSKLSEIWSGMFILILDLDFLPIPNPGSRGQKKGTGSRIRIRNTDEKWTKPGLRGWGGGWALNSCGDLVTKENHPIPDFEYVYVNPGF